MLDKSITNLLNALYIEYGEENIRRYNPDNDHGICILINEIPATFSIITFEGSLALNFYSIQIEDNPLGEYIYIDDSISLNDLLILIRRY